MRFSECNYSRTEISFAQITSMYGRQRGYQQRGRGYRPPVPKYSVHVDNQDLGTTRPERFRTSMMDKMSGKTKTKEEFDYKKIKQPTGPLPPPWDNPRFYNLPPAQQRYAQDLYTQSLKQNYGAPAPEPERPQARSRSRRRAAAPPPPPTDDYDDYDEEEPEPSLSIHAATPAERHAPAPATKLSADVGQRLDKFEQAIKELNQANQVVYAQLWKDDGLRVYRNLPGEGKVPEVVHTYQKGSHWVKLKHPLKRLTDTGDTYMKTDWVNHNDAAVCNGWVRVVEGSTRDIPFSAYSAFPRDDASEARLAYLEKTVEQLTETLGALSSQMLQVSLGSAAPSISAPVPTSVAAPVPTSVAAPTPAPDTAPRSFFQLPSMPTQ